MDISHDLKKNKKWKTTSKIMIMEDELNNFFKTSRKASTKMEDDLKKNGRRTSKMEDDLKKWKTT